MENLESIKEKIEKFLKEFENEEIITPDDAINRFKELFKDELIEKYEKENHPYFKSYNKKFYIKNGYGIGIEKVWGSMDISTRGLPSHEGVDVYLFSNLSDKYITLFDEDVINNELENVNNLYDFDLSIKNLSNLSLDNDFAFKCLPENIRNNDSIVKERYEKLKIAANYKHDDDIEDDLISYYGGLDVTINSTEYYLYNSLLENIEDIYFIERAIPLFVRDFPNYIDTQINSCEHALYMINHKEEFYKIADLKEKIDSYSMEFNDLEIAVYSHLKEQGKMQTRLDEILSEFTELKNKKYTFIELIIGKRKKDNIKFNNIKQEIEDLKLEIERVSNELVPLNEDYKSTKETLDMAEKNKQDLSGKLEKPFEDFTLDSDFENDTYIDGRFYLKVSLDRLINKENEYKQRLNELQKMKSYSIGKEITIKNENEIEYDYN